MPGRITGNAGGGAPSTLSGSVKRPGPISIVVIVLAVAVVGLLVYGVAAGGEDSSIDAAVQRGEQPVAPGAGVSLPLLDGKGSLSLSELRGKVVVLNFWASWCEPCRDEAPALERFYRKHRAGGTTVLGINLDDATRDAEAFVSEFGLTYPQLRDGDGRERRDAYGMTGFPESFLVDPEGKIALIRRGPVTSEYLDEFVDPIVERN